MSKNFNQFFISTTTCTECNEKYNCKIVFDIAKFPNGEQTTFIEIVDSLREQGLKLCIKQVKN